jgi:hypothetical protein
MVDREAMTQGGKLPSIRLKTSATLKLVTPKDETNFGWKELQRSWGLLSYTICWIGCHPNQASLLLRVLSRK